MKKNKLLFGLSVVTTLGALAPILITTSCNNSVTLSDADKTFLNDINTVIKDLDFEGVPFKAVHAVKNAGYKLFEYKFSNSQFQLVLNMNDGKNEYCALYNDTLFTPSGTITQFDKNRVWKFVETYDPNSEYAQHLNDSFKWDSNKTLEVTGCLDTGTNTNVKRIKYVGTSNQKTTYLRTYTEFLTIEPKAQDTIHHYHYADNVFVNGNGGSHYLEYGRSCYSQAKNTKISFALTKAQDEPCAIDVFEPVDANVEIVKHEVGANVYSKAGNIATKGTGTYKYGELEIKPVATIDELIAIEEKCLVRLTKDIEVDGTSSKTWNVNKNMVLDLCGHSIISPYNATDTTIIDVANGTLILMDSGGPYSDAAIKGSESIVVKCPNDDQTARFIMNGGKIMFGVNLDEKRSAIVVGSTETIPTGQSCISEFYMYGGEICAQNIKESDDCAAYAITTTSKGSYSYFVYGDVYGDNGAVVTDDSETEETEGSEIEVFGGNFVSNNSSICINLRKQSKFTVYGGSFQGGTCIGNINSEVTLNGGVYHATGAFSKKLYEDGALVCDGSVIECYWADYDTGDAQPNVISNNVQMHSAYGNILHLSSDDGCVVTTGEPKNWMEFISGCYYFNGSVHEQGCNAGMLYDGTTYNKFEWLQKGLWNNKPVK